MTHFVFVGQSIPPPLRYILLVKSPVRRGWLEFEPGNGLERIMARWGRQSPHLWNRVFRIWSKTILIALFPLNLYWIIPVLRWCTVLLILRALKRFAALYCKEFRAVLRIHDIFVWIQIHIRGSMPLTNGSGSGCGSGSCYFYHWPSRRQQKNIKKRFFCLLLFEGTFTSIFKDKKSKRSHKTVEIKVLLTIFA